MTREQAKEVLPVIQAFVESKTIQVRSEKPPTSWVDSDESFMNFECYNVQYRVKPEPREFWLRSPKGSSLPWNVWFKKPDHSPDHEVIHVREVLD